MTRAPQRDGRKARTEATRAAILAATRETMAIGVFRPTVANIVQLSGVSHRSVYQHFPTMEALYFEAIDAATAHEIVNRLPVSDEVALALTVVLGRVP